MPLRSIALVGANGTLGPHILSSLLTSTSSSSDTRPQPTFSTITILTRQSSKSTYPPSPSSGPQILTRLIPDSILSTPHSQLTKLFTDIDALIISTAGSLTDIHLALINAAYSAGVSHIIPADFGSCDSTDPHSLELLPLYRGKKRVRDRLIELSTASTSPSSSSSTSPIPERQSKDPFSWTAIVNGHFFDFGLKSGLLMMDLDAKKAQIFDGGDKKFSLSMLRTVGEAVVAILKDEQDEVTRNKIVYVQSVSTTQNELLDVVERIMSQQEGKEVKFGREEWDSREFMRVKKEDLESGTEDKHGVTEELVGVEGIVNADWEAKEGGVWNERLGMKKEKGLEGLVREILGVES